MKTVLKNEIFDDKTTAKIVDELQPILVELIALGLITKQAHWNVTGPSFRSIHLELDVIWDSVQANVDTVAERIATLAVSPSGQANDVAETVKVSPIPSGFLKDVQVLDLMIDRIGQVCRHMRERMANIEDVDTVTADLLHAILDGLEKHLWMLRSQAL